MKQYLIPFIVGVCFVIVCLLSFKIGSEGGYQRGYSDALNAPHKADTVFKTDTHFIEKPVEVVKWKDREKPVYVPKDSLIYIHDTTLVAMPREFKQYSREEYEAQVSGIDPSLDWIKVFPKSAYITNTVIEKRKWSLGVTVGPSVVWDGKVHAGIGGTFGLGYNF